MSNKLVSVIVPTFNRSHIISKTLPTYIQENVLELIVIDDYSTDNTEEIIQDLQHKYPLIKYYRSPIKLRQTGAKNIGIKMAKGNFIYFGDDDSVLKKDSIKNLLAVANSNVNSIIGVRHIYMKEEDNLQEILLDDYEPLPDHNLVFDPTNLKLDLRYKLDKIIEIPFCQACMLIPSKIIQENLFHTNFIGTCYREETDFVMQLAAKGHKILLDNYSLQVNLPKSQSSGGIRSVNSIYRHFSEVVNEYIFYRRNKYYIQSISKINTVPIVRSFAHLFNKLKK